MKFPDDVKKIILRKFQNNYKEWLKQSVAESESNSSWPLIINLDVPTEQQALNRQDDVRTWILLWKKFEEQCNFSLVWTERNWQKLGTQKVPEKIILNQPENVIILLEKKDEWDRAMTRYKTLIQKWATLTGVLHKHYDFLANSKEKDFLNLIEMLSWLCNNPKSNLYPRQIPVEGVDSKWLELHKTLVSEFIDAIHGVTQKDKDFYKVCGLKPLPQLIRMRILDCNLRKQLGGLCDISIPIEDMANMDIKPKNVFIVENLQTGLAFLDLPDSVVIMGLGYGVDVLENIHWLRAAKCFYWGDIDTHGFAILNRARKCLPSLESILMDEKTLLNHQDLWVEEDKKRALVELPLLNDSEQKVYNALKNNIFGQNIRLEQERINWDAAWKKVKEIAG